jgi:hypothetical protein
VCYSLWYTSCNTQSGAPEDGREHRPKNVELTGIINRPLLLHLVGVYIIYKLRFFLFTPYIINYEGRSEINASYLFPWKLH